LGIRIKSDLIGVDSEAGTDFILIQQEFHELKKQFSFILALLYFSSAVGATIHQHYCMGELVGFSLFDTQSKACGKCGMEKHTEESKDCCKDVSIVIKPGDSHTFSQPDYNLTFCLLTIAESHFTICELRIKQSSNNTTYCSHSPPLLKQPFFIQYQNLRI
jgi:hypothetical protein